MTELPLLWSSLFRDLNLPYKAHRVVLLTQHVNQKLFEGMLRKLGVTAWVSQTCLTFFCELEKRLEHTSMCLHLECLDLDTKMEIVSNIVEDTDVLFAILMMKNYHP